MDIPRTIALGGQYNREMKHLMLAHAFRFVQRVVFRVGPNNHRSQRALEKIGASYVGPEPDPRRGHPAILFEITRDAFARASLTSAEVPTPNN